MDISTPLASLTNATSVYTCQANKPHIHGRAVYVAIFVRFLQHGLVV